MLEPEAVAPGAVQATPRPPMPKANQPEAKRARMERWKKDPSEMDKDMAKQREALARAEKEDAKVPCPPTLPCLLGVVWLLCPWLSFLVSLPRVVERSTRTMRGAGNKEGGGGVVSLVVEGQPALGWDEFNRTSKVGKDVFHAHYDNFPRVFFGGVLTCCR